MVVDGLDGAQTGTTVLEHHGSSLGEGGHEDDGLWVMMEAQNRAPAVVHELAGLPLTSGQRSG